jgi:uncharacterized protein (TIGR02246 family)
MKTSFFLALAVACLSAPFAPAALAQQQAPQTFAARELGNFEFHRDRAEIAQVLKSYEQVLNASDVQGVVKLYTDDAVFMVPGSPSAVGIQAVEQAYVATFQAIRLNLTFHIAELHVLSPEWAFLRSTSSGQVTILANGAVIPSANQELFLLRKAHGHWKLARYSLSSTLPG